MNKKLILTSISIIMIISSIQINSETSSDIIIKLGPYPQNTKLNSTYIIWQTNIKTDKNSISYGLNTECNITLYQNNNTDFHKIYIDKLKPSQKYYYKVISNEIESDIYSFYTSFNDNESIKFIVYGDTRGVWDNWKNASIIAQEIEKENPYFTLHTGDIVNDGRNISQWIDFFSISKYIHNCTLYPVIGNHEYYNESYLKYFKITKDCYWYSFDNGPVHFVGLDSNKRNRYNPNQTIWLIKDLMNNEKSFTIVFFHHPPYSSGNHGSTYPIRFIWSPIFSYFNVDIVFNGHDHCYERGRVNNVNYIVSGGGGAPLYKVNEKWWTIYSEKTFHYCLINVDQFSLTIEIKKPDGFIIDTFSIEK
jgi:hypothetical protein